MVRLVTLLLTLFMLTACGMRTVKPSQVVTAVPPDSLLQDCPVDEPPKDLTKPTLVKAWNNQTINLADCNNDKGKLREWKAAILKMLK